MSKLNPELRQRLWEALDKLSRQHRAFQDAKWALPMADLDQIDEIATKFQPVDPVTKNRFLFDDHMPDVGTKRSDGLVAYEAMVREARTNAMRAIVSAEGLPGVQRLVDSTKLPSFVGLAVADSGVDIEEQAVLADLDSQDRRRVDFAFGFVRQRINIDGLSWVDTVLPQLAAAHSPRPVSCALPVSLQQSGNGQRS